MRRFEYWYHDKKGFDESPTVGISACILSEHVSRTEKPPQPYYKYLNIFIYIPYLMIGINIRLGQAPYINYTGFVEYTKLRRRNEKSKQEKK